jgi:pimeloyl-ACP methyl ester carboxylesterase
MNRLIPLIICLALGLALNRALAEEVKLQHGDLTLNANLEKVGDNWPEGPVILITHGTLAHNAMEIIEALQGLFAENGYSTLAMNLSLGLTDRHGMYDCATPHTHKNTDALDEIGLWLEWLKKEGARKVVLLGHSRGGNQVAWFAAEHDDPAVTAVVLIAPLTWNEAYAAKDYERRYGKPLAPVLNEARKRAASGQAEAWLEHTDFLYCKDTRVSPQAFLSYYAPDPHLDAPYLFPSIKKPVLVFAGTEDQVVKDLAERLAPLAEAETIRLQAVDGADHMFRDLYAEELVEAVAEFLGEGQ